MLDKNETTGATDPEEYQIALLRMAEISRPASAYERTEGTDEDHTQRDKEKQRDGYGLTSVVCRLINASAVFSRLVS